MGVHRLGGWGSEESRARPGCAVPRSLVSIVAWSAPAVGSVSTCGCAPANRTALAVERRGSCLVGCVCVSLCSDRIHKKKERKEQMARKVQSTFFASFGKLSDPRVESYTTDSFRFLLHLLVCVSPCLVEWNIDEGALGGFVVMAGMLRRCFTCRGSTRERRRHILLFLLPLLPPSLPQYVWCCDSAHRYRYGFI